jgi:tetratricopeptide (TPR) repeat protein
MKSSERHQLKQNEFVLGVAKATSFLQSNRDQVVLTAIVVAVLVLGAGGFFFWRGRTDDRAGEMFGEAMAITEAQIVPPSSVGGIQAPGTYPTEKARLEAAVTAFQAVGKTFPSNDAGVAAKYQAAAALLSLDRTPEAEAAFQEVATSNASTMYGPLAKLGLANTYLAEKQYDKAIQIYTELAAQRDTALPVDGIKMQLGQAYLRAGKPQDARTQFKDIVDQFPDSVYAAAARTQLAQISAP